jgi:hypothetical protein
MCMSIPANVNIEKSYLEKFLTRTDIMERVLNIMILQSVFFLCLVWLRIGTGGRCLQMW